MREKEKEIKKSISNKVLGVLILSLMGMAAGAQTAPKRPQLVVGIMVEGLNDDYLSLLGNYFTEGGFRRLMRDGATIPHLDYGPGVDAAAATAIIFTGAAPGVNGIPAAQVYDEEARKGVSVMGNYLENWGVYTEKHL